MACCISVWLSIETFDESGVESYGDAEDDGIDVETFVTEDHVPIFGCGIAGRIETSRLTRKGGDADGDCSARTSESQFRPLCVRTHRSLGQTQIGEGADGICTVRTVGTTSGRIESRGYLEKV